MDSFDVLVIGAGISGLSLAHYCARTGLRTCVIEQSRRPGGAIHTAQFPQDFWLEMGAHTCYNSYGRLLDILEDLGLAEQLLPRERLSWAMWEHGRPRSVASRIHWIELLSRLPRLLTERRASQSVQAYYSSILGQRNFREVALPLLNAMVSQDARDFPAELIFKKRPRRKRMPRSFTLSGGLQTLTDAIISKDAFALATGNPVCSVELSRGIFCVATKGGSRFEAPALALATPAAAAARLLARPMPVLASALAGIRERRVASLGVVAHKDEVRLPAVAGLVGREDKFYSVVSRDMVRHPSLRGFVFHCKPGHEKAALLLRITEVLGIPRRRLQHLVYKTNVLPSLGLSHHRSVGAIDSELAGRRLGISGNYFAGLAIEDCIARSAGEAERLLALL